MPRSVLPRAALDLVQVCHACGSKWLWAKGAPTRQVLPMKALGARELQAAV